MEKGTVEMTLSLVDKRSLMAFSIDRIASPSLSIVDSVPLIFVFYRLRWKDLQLQLFWARGEDDFRQNIFS